MIKLYYARDVKSYAVEHYKQNADGTYPLAATESDTGLSGLQGALAAYTPKVYADGFTYDAELTTPAAPIVIPNDDSLVIRLYYARDVKRYAVEHYKQNADGTYPDEATESDTGLSGRQGDTATYTPKVYTDGFTYDAELTTPAAPIVIPNDDSAGDQALLRAGREELRGGALQAERGRDVPGLSRDGERHGLERTSRRAGATYTPKVYTDGFTYDAELTTPAAPIVIPNDDSLVIKLYYARDVKRYAVEHYKQNADGTYPDGRDGERHGPERAARRAGDVHAEGLRGGRVHVRRGTDDAGRADRDSERRQPGDQALLRAGREELCGGALQAERGRDVPDEATESDTGLSGRQGDTAAYTPRNYAADGFTYDAELTTPAAPIVIPNDDSLVIRLTTRGT